VFRKIKLLAITGLFISVVLSAACAAEESDRKERLIDLIKKPFQAILAPVDAEGLADLISRPVEDVLYPVKYFGKKMVITPGRTHEYIYNINKNVSVVDAEDIKRDQPKDLQEILARKAGIMVSGFFANAKDSQVDMRGFGETGLLNYVLLIDGRRTNQIDLSGPDLSQIGVDSIERIEIIRGANSVLYGDNATGGVINIITKRGEKGYRIKYKQEFGSYQYAKEYASIDGRDDFLDYFFNYSYQDSDGYRLNGAYEANDIFAAITVRPDDFLDVHFSSGYHRDWYGQPGALYPGNIQTDGRRGSRFPDSKAKTEDYYFEVDPRIFGQTSAHQWVFSCLTACRSRRSNSLNVGFNRYEANHHISSLEFKPKCEIGSLFLDETLENKLVFGMDCFRARDRILSGDITFTKSQLDIVKETFGIYASDNMLVDRRFIISGGVRGEWARYIFDQFQPAAFYDTQEPREIAFDAGVGYKYNERSQIYANFARSYRYPATDEFFQSAYETFDWWSGTVRVFPAVLNSGLKHQVGNNCEVGIKDNSFGFLDVNAAYYLIDNKNEIYYDPLTFQNQNYHHIVHHGLELEASADIFERISVFFGYTFQKSFFVGGTFASKNVPLVPENKVFAAISIKPIDPLNIDLAVNYVGSRYVASDQLNEVSRLKPYVTLDLGVSYEMENIRFFGRINNILNEKYFSNATKNWLGNTAFYPAPEMNLEGGVSVIF
jgi:iron complex outermembrane receptor protein